MENKITGTLYVVFRINDKKIKNTTQLKNWENHMDRTFDTPNADPLRTNENKIIIGSPDILKSFEEHTKGIKFRKNGVLARDIVLTASQEFFKKLSDEQIEQWIELNKQFLIEQFGDNCIYAAVHHDETSPHIHVCVIPKYIDKKNRPKLSNDIYFGGREMYSAWQDKYAAAMQDKFEELHRGIKGSKATHIQIQQYYKIINSRYNEKDYDQVMKKAQNSILLERQVKDLQNTLSMYCKSNKDISEDLEEMKKDKEVFRNTIKAMSEIYKIPQNVIKEVIRKVENKELNVKKDPGKELKK